MARFQGPAHGPGPAARGVSEAGGYAQAQPRPTRPSGVGAGRDLPAGAALLPGLATDLRALDPAVCAGDVYRTVVSPGCKCWRHDRGDQSLASQVIPDVPLWARSR